MVAADHCAVWLSGAGAHSAWEASASKLGHSAVSEAFVAVAVIADRPRTGRRADAPEVAAASTKATPNGAMARVDRDARIAGGRMERGAMRRRGGTNREVERAHRNKARDAALRRRKHPFDEGKPTKEYNRVAQVRERAPGPEFSTRADAGGEEEREERNA